MLNSKINRIVLIVSAPLIIALVIYAVLRDRAELLSLHTVEQMVQKSEIVKVIASEKYIYLKTEAGFYKISTLQVPPSFFSNFKSFLFIF